MAYPIAVGTILAERGIRCLVFDHMGTGWKMLATAIGVVAVEIGEDTERPIGVLEKPYRLELLAALFPNFHGGASEVLVLPDRLCR